MTPNVVPAPVLPNGTKKPVSVAALEKNRWAVSVVNRVKSIPVTIAAKRGLSGSTTPCMAVPVVNVANPDKSRMAASVAIKMTSARAVARSTAAPGRVHSVVPARMTMLPAVTISVGTGATDIVAAQVLPVPITGLRKSVSAARAISSAKRRKNVANVQQRRRFQLL